MQTWHIIDERRKRFIIYRASLIEPELLHITRLKFSSICNNNTVLQLLLCWIWIHLHNSDPEPRKARVFQRDHQKKIPKTKTPTKSFCFDQTEALRSSTHKNKYNKQNSSKTLHQTQAPEYTHPTRSTIQSWKLYINGTHKILFANTMTPRKLTKDKKNEEKKEVNWIWIRSQEKREIKQLFDESREWMVLGKWEAEEADFGSLRDEEEVKTRLSGKGSREEKKATASTQK